MKVLIRKSPAGPSRFSINDLIVECAEEAVSTYVFEGFIRFKNLLKLIVSLL
jgi:hypothetical protein